MKRQLSNTIYGLKFSMELNDFERLKSSSGKKRNDFVGNSIFQKRIIQIQIFFQVIILHKKKKQIDLLFILKKVNML